MSTDEKLDWIVETLKRIEARQIKTTAQVAEVVKSEASQVQGSFGTTEPEKS